MFCPSCGAEYTIELKYCNRCGANLSSALLPAVEVAPISVTKPILIIGILMLVLTLGGFAGILSSAVELTARVGGGDLSMAIVFFGMITILTVDVLLFRLLSKLITAALRPDSGRSVRIQKPLPAVEPQMPHANTAQMLPTPSVTENTTRLLEGQYQAPVISEPPTRASISPQAANKSR